MKRVLFANWILCLVPCLSTAAAVSERVTSIYLSQTFLNEQLKTRFKPGLLRDLNVELDSKQNQIFLRGIVQVPVDELRAVNLDPKLGAFRFQVTIHPEATKEGFLILEFPLNETFFYPAVSKNPQQDRVLIPVQMLSLALASARGYLSALSGDYSSLDRKADKLKALVKALDKSISTEKNLDAKEAMINERDVLRLQLKTVPIERKQMQALSRQVGSLLGFTGEKELNLNDQFQARQNALIIKLNLAKLTPYLTGVELGGVRILHDLSDGPKGESYFSVDINADAESGLASGLKTKLLSAGNSDRGLEAPPSAIIRINQALFESELIVSAEKKAMGSKLQDLRINFKDDGLHVSGKYHRFFISVPFDTTVDFETKEADSFEVKVRDVQIAGMDFEFLTGFVLQSIQSRLDQSLKGICTFEYLGEQKDHSRALKVHVNPQKLIPALPGLHLIDVDVQDSEFLLKIDSGI